jgi:hypothetical protein
VFLERIAGSEANLIATVTSTMVGRGHGMRSIDKDLKPRTQMLYLGSHPGRCKQNQEEQADGQNPDHGRKQASLHPEPEIVPK